MIDDTDLLSPVPHEKILYKKLLDYICNVMNLLKNVNINLSIYIKS